MTTSPLFLYNKVVDKQINVKYRLMIFHDAVTKERVFLMKRVLTMLFAILLIFTACANLNEEETIKDEFAPEVDYTEYAVYTKGTSIILDWNTVRKKALLPYEKFCDLDEIEFDLNTPFDNRYIDYDGLDVVETEVSGGGFAQAAMPNGNFLTDGVTRMKLCPDKICRENENQVCTHINLAGGYVWGNYVYYIGKYKAEEQKSGQWNAEYENYLLRYSIPEHEVQVVVRLPWYCCITEAAYGVLYIAYVESVPFHMTAFHPNTLVYDCENVRLALVQDFDGLFLAESDWGDAVWGDERFYYVYYGNTIRRCEYDLSSQTDIGTIESGFPTLIGYAKQRVFYTLFDYTTGNTSVMSLKDDGRLRTVIESCTDAALITVDYSSYLYTIERTEIVRYKLDRVGRGEERTVVFKESDKLDANEHLKSMESVKEAIYFTTDVGQHTNHTRTYLLTEQGAVLDKESGAPRMEETEDETNSPVPAA